jgi:hypothetical protein
MLVMFLLAAAYSRWKHRGIVLGLLLALLANTNVHSVVLAFGFLAFWFFDLLFDRQSVAKHYVNLALNSAIAACGVLLCVATVYPPFNDAAQASNGSQGILVLVLRAVLLPFVNFDALYPGAALSQLFPQLDHNSFYQNLVVAALSFLLYGSTLGLAKRPAAMIGALLALVGLSLLFTLVYPGQYRHQALWPAFLVTMYAVVAAADGPADPRFACKRLSGISMFGSTLFVLLLILQVVVGGVKIWQAVTSGLPFSQSKSFAELVLQSPDLADAIIAADPDYLVEPLAYYLPNRTYLLREGRFGNVVKFTKGAQLSLNLNDIRQRALALRDTYHVPIVILLERRLDDVQTNDVIKEGYDWTLSLSPEDVATFKDATEMIRSFGPVVGSDETFDAYRLK